jgi:hypothetical protein|tara:strand:+ start:29 stop:952 length:924 start_codon:yes stop_codon:yes gene_type:complete
MPNWVRENLLIKYWKERCSFYEYDGRKILEAKPNTPLSAYPDISEHTLEDGSIGYPAEIEWKTSDFNHPIEKLSNNGGFLIVFSKDQNFPLDQIEINHEDFRQWFSQSATDIAKETELEVIKEKNIKKLLRPQLLLLYVPKTGMGKKNLKIAVEKGVWGFPEKSPRTKSNLEIIQNIKKGDILVVVHHLYFTDKIKQKWMEEKKSQFPGGRVDIKWFDGIISELYGLLVTSDFYHENKKNIWADKIYPYRFKFRKLPLFKAIDVPCNSKTMGKDLLQLIRFNEIKSGIISNLSSTNITKMLSLCANV